MYNQKPVPSEVYSESWHQNNSFWIFGDSLEAKRKTEGKAPELIVKTFSKPFKKLNVLDAGCDKGYLMYLLKEQGANVTGVDYSSYSIKNSVCPGDVLLGEITKIPFKDNSFDLVIAREVFEHLTVEQADKAFEELIRVTDKYIYLTIWLNFDPNAKDDEVLTDFERDETHITFSTRKFWQNRFDKYIEKGIIKERKDMEETLDWLKKGRVWCFEKL